MITPKKDHFTRPFVLFTAFWAFSCFWSLLAGICLADTYSVTYQYDASSRLTGVEYSDGTTIEYTYDATGNMVTKKVYVYTPSECAECSASPVNLTNVTFESGRKCTCSDGASITLGTGVTVESGAEVIFKAPIIRLKSGFKAKTEAVVKMERQ